MPTKRVNLNSREKDELQSEILALYLKGLKQEEIYTKIKGSKLLKGSKKISKKKLQNLIKENHYLSPKNFRLGALLLFFLTILTPPITVYVRGYEYRAILNSIILVSVIFSSPFFVFAILMRLTKNLKTLYYLSASMIVYLVIYILIFLLISDDIDIWTLVLFPLVLMPTFIEELLKLRKLIFTIEKNHH